MAEIIDFCCFNYCFCFGVPRAVRSSQAEATQPATSKHVDGGTVRGPDCMLVRTSAWALKLHQDTIPNVAKNKDNLNLERKVTSLDLHYL